MTSANVSRRGFMKIMAVAGGGMTVGFLVEGCSHVSGGQALGGGFHPNSWVKITPDNTVTFFLDRAEMGQGVTTSHAQLLAEELEIAVDKINVQFAPADYDAFGVQLTGGSTSVTSQWDIIRTSGATARELMRRAAAKRWGVAVEEVTAKDGALHHAKHGKITYGEISSDAAKEHISEDEIKLKDPKEWKVIGKPVRRIDAAAKTNGSAVFGMDVKVDGMLTAVVIRPPVLRGVLKRFDARKALEVKGVKKVMHIPQGVAVVADSYWAARKAANLVDVSWDDGAMATFSTDDLRKKHMELLKEEAKGVGDHGDIEAALASAPKKIRAVYEVPFLHHSTMEPMNATAHVEERRTRVWVPTQAPTIVKDAVSRLTGHAHRDIDVITTFMGGGFGRRALADFVGEAVEISKRMKAPIKVVWSREDDMRHGQFRPASMSLMEGAVGADGMPIVWHHRMTGQSIVYAFANMLGALAPEMMPRPIMDLLGAGMGKLFIDGHVVDPTAVEGANDHPYKIPNQKVELAIYESGIPVFPWRSVGHSINAFVVESFIDELAHLGGKDPVALRRALLVDHPRHLAVVNAAAKAIGWDEKPAPGRFRGIAQHHCFQSYCAHAIEISVENGLKVHRVVSAIDCGRAVNPDLVAAQMESGVLYGLSAALKQRIDFDAGRVRQSNFHDYPMLRMHEAPQIDTIILPSEERPTGVGELAVPPVAPALTNAIFAATGVRLRRLPLEQDIALVLSGKKPQEVTL